MICFAICFFAAFCLRWVIYRENYSRDREFGFPEVSHGLEDMTDRENKSFRYNL